MYYRSVHIGYFPFVSSLQLDRKDTEQLLARKFDSSLRLFLPSCHFKFQSGFIEGVHEFPQFCYC